MKICLKTNLTKKTKAKRKEKNRKKETSFGENRNLENWLIWSSLYLWMYWALNLGKLLRVWLIQWLFWRESEIFLENQTLYPICNVIKCMLCTTLKIVLWDRVIINCTEMSKADRLSSYEKCNNFHAILISYKTDNKFNRNTRKLN